MYVLDFQVSLNARISCENQYPRVSQPLLYTPVFPSPSSTTSLVLLLPLSSSAWIYSLTHTFSRVLHLLRCTVYHPLPLHRVEWSKAERSGMERCGRPPLMNVILRRGEWNTAACLPPLVPLHPFLPPTLRQTRSLLLPSPHYHLLFYINFHHVNLPTSRFSSPAATSLPSRHTTTKHSI